MNLGLAGGDDAVGPRPPRPRSPPPTGGGGGGGGGLRQPLLAEGEAVAGPEPRGLWRVVLTICRLATGLLTGVQRFFTSMFQVRSFEQEFARRYRSHPAFFQGTFRAAITHGREAGKLVCVYLHCDIARQTAPFCKDVLGHEAVVEVLDREYVFWAGDIMTMEAHDVARALNVREYPCVYLLLPTTGTPQVEAELHGTIGVDQLLAQLTHSADQARDRLAAGTGTATSIRAEQDREYQEALALDRVREQEREAARKAEADKADAARRAAEEQREAESRKRAATEELLLDRSALADRFRARPAPAPPTVRIQLRADAGKATAEFSAAAPLREVAEWAEACAVMHNLKIPEKFLLVRSYPVKELDDLGASLESLGLAPSAALLVKDLDA